jgi:hypothetical protein
MCTHQNLAIVGFDRSFGWNWTLCQTFGPLVGRRIAKRTWKLSFHYHLIKLCVLKLNPRCFMAKSSFSGMAKSPFDGFSNVYIRCNPHENPPSLLVKPREIPMDSSHVHRVFRSVTSSSSKRARRVGDGLGALGGARGETLSS